MYLCKGNCMGKNWCGYEYMSTGYEYNMNNMNSKVKYRYGIENGMSEFQMFQILLRGIDIWGESNILSQSALFQQIVNN